MKFLIGKKEAMTQIFSEDGKVHPVTVIEAGPIVVAQIKTKEKDGYSAIQFGFGAAKEKRMTKAEKGHLKEVGNLAVLKEFRVTQEEAGKMKNGDRLDVSIFSEGEKVTVSAISKGKGFQGGVKRHGFHGGPRTHGQKHSEREPGSIGGGLRTRVPKGMRMAGRMGGDRITVKNLKVIAANKEKNLLLVQGAVPGRRGTVVEIKG
ncbi:MAG: 50S ribosomal protein L3 [Patescibacteria group bacterium]|nr:50S ribosomal protein L3 [bacterium]MDZ4240805.1 50S ribosomal protein L3 [Patescibacteria group bacterium]